MIYKKNENFNYDLKHIGKKIREEREKHKLTQSELAAIVGLSPSYISNIERGSNGDVGFLKICNIVQGLNITLNDITATNEISEEGLTLSIREDKYDSKAILINMINNLNDAGIEFTRNMLHALHDYNKSQKSNLSDSYEYYFSDIE